MIKKIVKMFKSEFIKLKNMKIIKRKKNENPINYYILIF